MFISARASAIVFAWRLAGVSTTLAVTLLLGPPSLGAAPHTVTIPLVAGQTPTDGGFNFNGYGRGNLVMTVPVGWKVVVDFENASVLPHSAIVLPYATAQPPAPPTTPAFAGATTPNLAAGLPQHAKATFSFVTSHSGTYECD